MTSHMNSLFSVPAITTPSYLEGSCPGEEEGEFNWVHFGQHCYLFKTNG